MEIQLDKRIKEMLYMKENIANILEGKNLNDSLSVLCEIISQAIVIAFDKDERPKQLKKIYRLLERFYEEHSKEAAND